MIPVIPPKLLPWVDYVPGGVELKEGAPKELEPLFEEFKARMKRAEEEMLMINGKPFIDS